MIKKNILYIVIFCLLSSCTGYGYGHDPEQNATFQTIQGSLDIPLAKGLEIQDDNVINFDSLNGNIISTAYTTKEDLNKIKNFYLRTLPQMGWEVVANEFLENSDIVYFKRDNETLEIEFLKEGDENTIKFFGKLEG